MFTMLACLHFYRLTYRSYMILIYYTAKNVYAVEAAVFLTSTVNLLTVGQFNNLTKELSERQLTLYS